MNPDSDALADRYGRSPRTQHSQRWIVVALAGGLVIAFVLWLLWRGSIGADSVIDAQVAAFEAIDDTAMEVTVVIDFDPADTASCAIEIQSSNKSIVGWIIVDVPASDSRARVIDQRVNTTERGVVGLISRCWLT